MYHFAPCTLPWLMSSYAKFYILNNHHPPYPLYTHKVNNHFWNWKEAPLILMWGFQNELFLEIFVSLQLFSWDAHSLHDICCELFAPQNTVDFCLYTYTSYSILPFAVNFVVGFSSSIGPKQKGQTENNILGVPKKVVFWQFSALSRLPRI